MDTHKAGQTIVNACGTFMFASMIVPAVLIVSNIAVPLPYYITDTVCQKGNFGFCLEYLTIIERVEFSRKNSVESNITMFFTPILLLTSLNFLATVIFLKRIILNLKRFWITFFFLGASVLIFKFGIVLFDPQIRLSKTIVFSDTFGFWLIYFAIYTSFPTMNFILLLLLAINSNTSKIQP